jgi:dihydroorotase-like cyclic amidohydrolase
MNILLITNAIVVNENKLVESDILVVDGYIDQVGPNLSHRSVDQVIDAGGSYVLPGVIDDQVHFREPGLTHKATIRSESRAAVAGGVTTFMEMPNTVPNALTQELLADKYAIAARSSMANYSFFMGELARRHNTRLHILHISTADELPLFTGTTSKPIMLQDKRITSEVCVHHLWYDSRDYGQLGNQIKCNPAIKDAHHKEALLAALLDDRLDIIATDHAPHTWEEKQQSYWQAPSGLPLVQHPLLMMLEFVQQGKLSIETMVRKMCHAPADCFQIEKRGYIREGYWADLVLVDVNQPTTVSKENLFYQCGWSPLEGHTFGATVTHTIVSGELVYQNGSFLTDRAGQRLLFNR